MKTSSGLSSLCTLLSLAIFAAGRPQETAVEPAETVKVEVPEISKDAIESPPEVPETFLRRDKSCFMFFPGTIQWSACVQTFSKLVSDLLIKFDSYETDVKQWEDRLPGSGPIEVSQSYGIQILSRGGLKVKTMPDARNPKRVNLFANVGKAQKVKVHKGDNMLQFDVYAPGESQVGKWVMLVLPDSSESLDLSFITYEGYLLISLKPQASEYL